MGCQAQNTTTGQYLTGLYLIFGESAACPVGYIMLNTDLNARAGGDFIHLCYTKDINAGPAITSIVFVKIDFTDIIAPTLPGYVPVPSNLKNDIL